MALYNLSSTPSEVHEESDTDGGEELSDDHESLSESDSWPTLDIERINLENKLYYLVHFYHHSVTSCL